MITKLLNFLSKATLWLTRSSADINKWSLTIQGAAIGTVTLLTMLAGLAHIHVSSEALTALIDTAVKLLQYIALTLSGIVTLVGLLRKIVYTIQGKNAVLNDSIIQ